MADKLFKRLEERFPPWKGIKRVSLYGAHERIYLILPGDEIKNSVPFSSHEPIEALAKEIFDVPFVYEQRGDIGPAVWFDPMMADEYFQRHHNHHLLVKLPFTYPMMTLDLGNRGNGTLLEKQRDNYCSFVEGVYQLFVDNAR